MKGIVGPYWPGKNHPCILNPVEYLCVHWVGTNRGRIGQVDLLSKGKRKHVCAEKNYTKDSFLADHGAKKKRFVTPTPRGHHYKYHSSTGVQRCGVYCSLRKRTLILMVGVVLVDSDAPQKNMEDMGRSNTTATKYYTRSDLIIQEGLLAVECKEWKIQKPYSNYTFVPGQWYLYGLWRDGFADGIVKHFTPVENVFAI